MGGPIGELAQLDDVLALPHREAQVEQLEALLERPVQAGSQRVERAVDVRAEHADADELDVGGERPDDAGARGAVARGVSAVVDDAELTVVVALDSHGTLHGTDERMVALDPR